MAQHTSLVKRIQSKSRYKGLMADGRIFLRVNPALRPWVKRYLDDNPGGMNNLVNTALAEHFDAQAAREKAEPVKGG